MKYLILLGIMLTLPFSASAAPIKGKVVDKKTQEALIGVSIALKDNPAVGTITDVDGNFSLSLNEQQDILRVTYIGYETCEIDLDKMNHPLVIEMNEDNFKLDEVVVTGQGAEISKRRLSSNVSTVSEKDLIKMPQGRIDQLLQNALPNVQITLSNGQPGTTSLIKSRGLSSAYFSSTPVSYVAGVRVDNMNTGAALNN